MPSTRRWCTADNTDCTALTYHGGLVQHSPQTDYMLFWMPAGHEHPLGLPVRADTWLGQIAFYDYSISTPFSVDQQFYDTSGTGGAKQFVPFAITSGGTLKDTQPYPQTAAATTAWRSV